MTTFNLLGTQTARAVFGLWKVGAPVAPWVAATLPKLANADAQKVLPPLTASLILLLRRACVDGYVKPADSPEWASLALALDDADILARIDATIQDYSRVQWLAERCDAVPIADRTRYTLDFPDPPADSTQPAADGTVHTADGAPPLRVEIVGMPDRTTTTEAVRDHDGNITKTRQLETDRV